MKKLPLICQRQRGVALVVALILLVVMTLVGLAGMRTVTLEEKMTGSTFDRSLAFQAAESGLREAEALAEAGNTTPPKHPLAIALNPDVDCKTGTPPRSAPCWELNNGWNDAAALVNGSISVQPEYVLEYVDLTGPCDSTGNDCHLYRITARIKNVTDRSQVVLQSNYIATP